jgi:hypothetical protein
MMRVLRPIALALGALGFSLGAASAADIHHICAAPGDLQAAIDALDVVGPHTISVTGPCSGNIQITNRDRLTLQGFGGPATIAASVPNAPAIQISGSRNILIAGLRIGGGTGIGIIRASTVDVIDVHVDNSGGPGIGVNHGSVVMLGGNAPQAVEIRGSQGAGIGSDSSVIIIRGSVTIENNGAALNVNGGRLAVNGTQADNVFRNNGGGLNISTARATFNGQNLIQNNGGVGMQVSGGAFATFSAAAGGTRVTIIEGHGNLGMNIAASAGVGFAGPHKIRQNGASAPPDAPSQGGINVGTTSRIQIDGGTEITNNVGPGLTSRFNGALSVNNAVITNNTGPGLLVIRQSVAGLLGANVIDGNGGANIACDTTSLVYGDLVGLTGIDCKRIEREHGPPRPGEIKEGTSPN